MAIRRFSSSAAVLALVAGIGSGALAQTAAPADLPAPIAGLNLTNLEIDTKRGGMREVEGRTAEGVKIEARIDRAGNLVEVEADDGILPQSLIDAMVPAAVRDNQVMPLFGSITEVRQRPEHLEVKGRQPGGAEIEAKFNRQNALIGIEVDDAAVPAGMVNALLPQAVRNNEIVAQFARIDEVENRNGRIKIEGEDASGRDMRADFDADGRVLRFGSEDGPRGERRGPGHRDHGPSDHARHGEGPGEHPMGGPRAGGPGRDGRGPAPVPADFDAVPVNQRLTQAGYSNFGFLRAQGPCLVLEATNPQGEPVMLELDRQGELVRETAR